MRLFPVLNVAVSSPQCRPFCKNPVSILFSSLNSMVAKVLVVTFRIVAAVVSATRLSTPQGTLRYQPRQSNEVPGQRVQLAACDLFQAPKSLLQSLTVPDDPRLVPHYALYFRPRAVIDAPIGFKSIVPIPWLGQFNPSGCFALSCLRGPGAKDQPFQ